jgi:superoxide dismutase, Cu-Zn family
LQDLSGLKDKGRSRKEGIRRRGASIRGTAGGGVNLNQTSQRKFRITPEQKRKRRRMRGRSIMIHAGGDNYSDTPAPLGGGGARTACGVIK